MKVPGIIDNRVTVAFAEGIADVRMNRPDKRNALDGAGKAGALAAHQFAAERDEIHRLIGSDNQTEAVQAYFEKRAPVFKD